VLRVLRNRNTFKFAVLQLRLSSYEIRETNEQTMTESIAFIFDMDGTVVDNMPVHNQIWQEILAEEGVRIDKGEFNRQTTGKTTPEILRSVLGEKVDEAEIERIAKKKEAKYRKVYRPHLVPIDGLPDFLAESRSQQIPVALATSAGTINVEFVLSGVSLRPYFSVIVSGDEVTHGKPNPEIFLLAAQRLGIPPQRCLVFEDSLLGVEAACQAGMQAVAITTSIPCKEFEGRCPVLCMARNYTEIYPQELIQLFHARKV
jgi:beta-phosphoglucomutase family hydrolase